MTVRSGALDSLGYLFEQKGQHAPLNDGLSSPVQNSTKLAIVGDTGRTDNLIEIVRDADALVIEATYTDEEETMARQFSHLTARDAAGWLFAPE